MKSYSLASSLGNCLLTRSIKAAATISLCPIHPLSVTGLTIRVTGTPSAPKSANATAREFRFQVKGCHKKHGTPALQWRCPKERLRDLRSPAQHLKDLHLSPSVHPRSTTFSSNSGAGLSPIKWNHRVPPWTAPGRQHSVLCRLFVALLVPLLSFNGAQSVPGPAGRRAWVAPRSMTLTRTRRSSRRLPGGPFGGTLRAWAPPALRPCGPRRRQRTSHPRGPPHPRTVKRPSQDRGLSAPKRGGGSAVPGPSRER